MTRRRRWRPILEGSLRREALDAVREIAEALRYPHPARVGVPLDPELQAAYDLGLLTGRAGVAVFFGYLAESGLLTDAEELAWENLDQAEAGLGEVQMGPTLCVGITGIGWAHDHLHRHLARGGDGGELREIDAALLGIVRQATAADTYDLLHGLVGIGVYALERLPARGARSLAGLVVQRLAEQVVEVDGLAIWPTPVKDRRGHGVVNLGMAHGIPGVIGFLARAAEARIRPRITLPLLHRGTAGLLARQLPPDSSSTFTAACELHGAKGEASRTAWCYGDPGAAAGLLAAARITGEASWFRESVRIAAKAAARPPAETGVVDACLCHGSAGLVQVFNRIFQATGRKEFHRAAVSWVRRTLAYRRPGEGIGGFTALGLETPKGPQEFPNPGILSGSAGIGLALLGAATEVEPAWDRLLLLD